MVVAADRYSPGPIAEDEKLLRIIYYPQHIDDNGELRPEAIPRQDLIDRGFSVHRYNYVRKAKILKDIETYVSKRIERSCRGIAPIECKTVNSIEDTDSKQAFHVLEDARSEEDTAHAIIKFKNSYGPALQKKLRKTLKDEFNTIVDTENILESLPSNNSNGIKIESSLIVRLGVNLGRFFKRIWASLFPN